VNLKVSPGKYFSTLGIVILFSACGGGDGSGDSSGLLSLDVTDLPVTEDVDVCIHFTSITLHHSDGDLIQIAYDPSSYDDPSCISNRPAGEAGSENNAVNLSALQGELSVPLMDTESVKAGRYNWIRLDIDESLSYVVDSEGQKDLSCPSCDGDQSGLKLNRGITVPAGGEAHFIIDLELNKSLKKNPSGDYTLRPTLRLVDMTETGKITGTVAASLIPEMISESDTGCKVYVYEGHDVVPDDHHEADNVLTSAKVLYGVDSDLFEYVAAFLPADSTESLSPYTIALTCDIEDMAVNQNNDPLNPAGDDVIFTDGITEGWGQNVDVGTNQTTTADFPPL
jgi:hypothetical protein